MNLVGALRIFSFSTKKVVASISARKYCDFEPEAKVLESKDGSEKVDVEAKIYDPKDRSQKIDVETSIRYLKSSAYKKTYGNDLVWQPYRRNFKGSIPPETRKTCIRSHRISTGSPCPICRDEYLVVHYKNIDLLNQFISPYGGEVYPSKKTGVCQKQQRKLLVEIQKAWNYGLITYDVPHRSYNYDLYYKLTTENE